MYKRQHIGFGFHRYSVDKNWLVPHFEKMLYDQALIAIIYTDAFQATGKLYYKKIAEEIFEYVLRDMSSPEGAFYSAEDADSEGVEGKFYVWTAKEIKEVLDHDEAEFISFVFNVKDDGNFNDGYSQAVSYTHLKLDLFHHRLECTCKLFSSKNNNFFPIIKHFRMIQFTILTIGCSLTKSQFISNLQSKWR